LTIVKISYIAFRNLSNNGTKIINTSLRHMTKRWLNVINIYFIMRILLLHNFFYLSFMI